jgi:hypothetical protein
MARFRYFLLLFLNLVNTMLKYCLEHSNQFVIKVYFGVVWLGAATENRNDMTVIINQLGSKIRAQGTTV